MSEIPGEAEGFPNAPFPLGNGIIPEFQALRSAQVPEGAGWRDWGFPRDEILLVSLRDSGRDSMGFSCRKTPLGSDCGKSWEFHSRGNAEFPRGDGIRELEMGYWDEWILGSRVGIPPPNLPGFGILDLGKGFPCFPWVRDEDGNEICAWRDARRKAGFGRAQGSKHPGI